MGVVELLGRGGVWSIRSHDQKKRRLVFIFDTSARQTRAGLSQRSAVRAEINFDRLPDAAVRGGQRSAKTN